jgi:branched-chain amino acid transport system substrate-binding protein
MEQTRRHLVGDRWRVGAAMTRRAALAALGGGAVAALLAACGEPEPLRPTPTARRPTATARPAPTVAAATSPAATGDGGTIVIVSSLPRQGTNKGQSDGIVNAVRLALKEAGNRAGPFTIEYRDWDDSSIAEQGNWDGNVERANAQMAVDDPAVMAYLGTQNSGAAKISIPILNQAGLLMISPANTYSGLTKPGMGEPNEPDIYYPTGRRTFCRVIPADDLQGTIAATWAMTLGARKAYVLDDRQLYGKGLADVFAASARRIGLEVVGREGLDPQAQDYQGLAATIKSAGADMVYFGGLTGTGGARFWKDARPVLGADLIMMGADGIADQAFLDEAGDAAEHTYVTYGGVPASELTGKGKTFLDAYTRAFNVGLEPYTIYGYDAAKALLAGIARAGVRDRAAIRDAVMATRDFDGALGVWSFDANGDTTNSTFSGSQVKRANGALAFVFATLLAAKP